MKKYNLVVPIAGRGQRMIDGGYTIPKPMMICGDRSILEWSMQSIDYSECNLFFVVQKEHIEKHGIDNWLKQKYGNEIHVLTVNEVTKGAAETVYRGLNSYGYHLSEKPLIVYCPDVTFEPIYKPSPEDFKDEGFILTFKANSPNYSYVIMSSLIPDEVSQTVEKVVPKTSNLASVGVYCFQTTKLFLHYARMYLNENHKEYHICPMYNTVMNNRGIYNGIIRQKTIDKIHIMGTPQEFKFFEEISFTYFLNRKFAICCDHSGFDLKQQILEEWKFTGLPQCIDFGCYNSKDCDYNLYVKRTCEHVIKNKEYFGIGICRSGQGINICANKQPGIRACLISDEYHASHAIKHNAGNFFSLSAIDFDNKNKLDNVLNILYTETFDGGRHQNRMMNND